MPRKRVRQSDKIKRAKVVDADAVPPASGESALPRRSTEPAAPHGHHMTKIVKVIIAG